LRYPYKELSLPQLRSFNAVCRLSSYANAARHLGLSTSTVWEQMRGLERYFDTSLLEKRGGALRPTPEGVRLLELLLPVLNGVESARETLLQQRGQLPASLTLASGLRMLLEEVSHAVASFRQRYPSVRLRVLHCDDREIEALVEHGDAQVALMLEPGPGRPRRTTVAHEPAYELEYVLVTPPRHQLARQRGLRLRDIVRHPLVLGVPGISSRRRLEEVLHGHGLLGDLQVAVETNSAALTFAYVRAGAGVGITAGNQKGNLCRGLGVRSLRKWFGSARYVFIWPQGGHVPPVQRALADLIRAGIERTEGRMKTAEGR
jgi:LysR family cys regulon transcriptional activator